jgi:hypothetical protein
MPTYNIVSPSGKNLRITGPTPPTEKELDQIFASVKSKKNTLVNQLGRGFAGNTIETGVSAAVGLGRISTAAGGAEARAKAIERVVKSGKYDELEKTIFQTTQQLQQGNEKYQKVADEINKRTSEFVEKKGYAKTEADGMVYDVGGVFGSLSMSVGTMLATGNPLVLAGIFGSSAYEQGLEEARAAGKTEAQAQAVGTLRGIVEGGLEMTGTGLLIKALKGKILYKKALSLPILKSEKFLAKKAIGVTQASAVEGLQEISQATGEELIQQILGGREKGFFQTFKDIFYQGLLGMIGGGTAGMIFTSTKNSYKKQGLSNKKATRMAELTTDLLTSKEVVNEVSKTAQDTELLNQVATPETIEEITGGRPMDFSFFEDLKEEAIPEDVQAELEKGPVPQEVSLEEIAPRLEAGETVRITPETVQEIKDTLKIADETVPAGPKTNLLKRLRKRGVQYSTVEGTQFDVETLRNAKVPNRKTGVDMDEIEGFLQSEGFTGQQAEFAETARDVAGARDEAIRVVESALAGEEIISEGELGALGRVQQAEQDIAGAEELLGNRAQIEEILRKVEEIGFQKQDVFIKDGEVVVEPVNALERLLERPAKNILQVLRNTPEAVRKNLGEAIRKPNYTNIKEDLELFDNLEAITKKDKTTGEVVLDQMGLEQGKTWDRIIGGGGYITSIENMLNIAIGKKGAEGLDLTPAWLAQEANTFIQKSNIKNALNLIYGKEKLKGYDKKDIPIKVRTSKNAKTFTKNPLLISKEEAIGFLASAQDVDVARRIDEWYGIDNFNKAIEGKLSAQDKKFVNFAVKYLAQYKGLYKVYNELQKQLGSSRKMGKVDAYFTIMGSVDGSGMASIFEGEGIKSENIQASITKARNNNVRPEPVPIFTGLVRYTEQAEWIKNVAPKQQMLYKKITNADVKRGVERKTSERYLAALTKQIEASGIKKRTDDLSQLMRKNVLGRLGYEMLSNWTAAKVGFFNPNIPVKQTVSMVLNANLMPTNKWIKGMTKSVANPVETWNFMMKNPEAKSRFERGMNEEMRRVIAGKGTWTDIKKINTLPLRVGDVAAIVFGGRPVVEYYMSKEGGGLSEREAFKKYFNLANKQQQSGVVSELSILQDSSNSLLRPFVMFKNAQMQYIKNIRKATLQWRRKEISLGEFQKTIFLQLILNPILFDGMGYFMRFKVYQTIAWAIKNMIDPDNDDPFPFLKTDLKEIATIAAFAPIKMVTSGIPFLGDIAQVGALAFLNRHTQLDLPMYGTSIGFITEVFDTVDKFGMNYAKHGFEKESLTDAGVLLGEILTSIGISSLIRTSTKVRRAIVGEERFEREKKEKKKEKRKRRAEKKLEVKDGKKAKTKNKDLEITPTK